MRRYIIIFFFLSVLIPVFAQQNNTESTEQVIENSSTGDDYNPEEWAENLEYFKTHPINLNTAAAKELRKLNLLSTYQIKSLLDYRSKNGFFKSIYELKLIYGWDEETIKSVLPYIMVKDPELDFQLKHNYGEHRVLARTSFHSFSNDSDYFTSSVKILTKYYYDLNDRIHAGFVTEKDYGETSFRGSNRTMDYVSGSLVLNNSGHVKTIAVGDYNACFGQGLMLWTGFGLGKTPYITNLSKNETGFTRYSSLDENRALRGAATTISLGQFDLSLFYSKRNIDANITEMDSSGKATEVSSIQITGLHTTASEIQDEKILPVQLAGTALRFQNHNFTSGLLFVNTRFGATFSPENTISNIPHFRGNEYSSIGANYKLFLSKTEWFGEAAMMDNKEYAYINGVVINLTSAISTSFLYRNYSKGYYALYSRCFADNSEPANEQGFFWGMQITPAYGMKINGYSDIFNHPWLKYYSNSPSYGKDYMIEMTYNVNENLTCYARLKQKHNQENAFSDTLIIDPLADQKRTTCRFQLSYKITERTELRNRIELCSYAKENTASEKGYYLHQDIVWRPEKKKISLWFRYAIFHTDGYNSRIYSYEIGRAHV
jgi:hypothetical protein